MRFQACSVHVRSTARQCTVSRMRGWHYWDMRLQGQSPPLLNLDSIGDASTGVIWCSAVEHAYHVGALGIKVDGNSNALLVLQDRTWAGRKLRAYASCMFENGCSVRTRPACNSSSVPGMQCMCYGWIPCLHVNSAHVVVGSATVRLGTSMCMWYYEMLRKFGAQLCSCKKSLTITTKHWVISRMETWMDATCELLVATRTHHEVLRSPSAYRMCICSKIAS